MNQELSPLSRMMLKLLVVDMSRQVLVEVTELDWRTGDSEEIIISTVF